MLNLPGGGLSGAGGNSADPTGETMSEATNVLIGLSTFEVLKAFDSTYKFEFEDESTLLWFEFA